MKKQLFFDDNKLFSKDNVTRKYGTPKRIAEYKDPSCSTDYCSGWVFKIDDKYRMLYFAHGTDFSGKKFFSAISDDGVNFVPEKLWDDPKANGKDYPHEIFSIPNGCEIAFVYDDEHCPASERYKLLMTRLVYEDLWVLDEIYTSTDLINWQIKENHFWGDGAEPLASVFYNKHKECHTICGRKFWGVRSAGYKETNDWQNFSQYNTCLNVDSLDEDLAEIYGMYAFEYEGMYIGIPHMYRGLKSELNAKYKNGNIDTQLAYSYDGRYWQRSLRVPFIGDATGEYPMTWVSHMVKCDDGSLNFYGSASGLEHGPAFAEPGTGTLFVYKLREDGFISLATKNKDEESVVATREKVWHGGDLHINIKAEKATVAVYITDESEMVTGNVLGVAKPIEGYSHEECVPFSGDCTDWVPEFKSGKKVSDLSGKTIVFEVKFTDGEIYSFAGDFTDVYNTEGARYRKFGVLPE